MQDKSLYWSVFTVHTHIFISSVQNYLVMCWSTQNLHVLLYFIQNKILNTYHLEVYLMR